MEEDNNFNNDHDIEDITMYCMLDLVCVLFERKNVIMRLFLIIRL